MKTHVLPLTLACICSACSGERQHPNVVLILADDMGYGDVSCLDSNSRLITPCIDRLAAEGVVFTDAHSSSSVSTPTRYGLLTGRYNWRSELKCDVLYGYSAGIIPPERETLGSMLRRQGYTTAAIGKWHLGWDWPGVERGKDSVDYTKPIANGPADRGFDYFFGFCGSLDMPPYVYVENRLPTAVPDTVRAGRTRFGWWRKGPTAPDFHHEQVLPELIDRACRYIEEHSKQDRPYFLYLPLPAPHTPILPTEEFRGKSGIGEYGDFVLMVDAMVGRVMEAVERGGKAANTIVVFTTDNGCSPAAGIEEMEALGHHPNSIYRGHKADLYDGGHRIPCILRWSQGAKPHTVEQTVCLTDFYATLADICGYRLKDTEGEDSYSLLPAIRSTTEVAPIREATIHHSIDGQFAVRQGKWKLLLSGGSGGWSWPTPADTAALDSLPAIQLYDMEADPTEARNVQDLYPQQADSLRRLLERYIRTGRSTPGAPQPNDGEYPWKQAAEIADL